MTNICNGLWTMDYRLFRRELCDLPAPVVELVYTTA